MTYWSSIIHNSGNEHVSAALAMTYEFVNELDELLGTLYQITLTAEVFGPDIYRVASRYSHTLHHMNPTGAVKRADYEYRRDHNLLTQEEIEQNPCFLYSPPDNCKLEVKPMVRGPVYMLFKRQLEYLHSWGNRDGKRQQRLELWPDYSFGKAHSYEFAIKQWDKDFNLAMPSAGWRPILSGGLIYHGPKTVEEFDVEKFRKDETYRRSMWNVHT